MAISSYEKDGQTLYRVRVQMQSFRFRSIRIGKQLGEIESLAEAEKVEAKYFKDLKKELLEKEMKQTVLGQNWNSVLESWHRAQCDVRVPFGSIRPETLEDYYRGVKRHMAEFDHVPAASINTLDLMRVFNRLTEQGMSFAYRQKLRTQLKAVFDYGIKSGMVNLQRNPAHELTLRKTEERKPEILTIAEIRKLVELAFARQHEWRHVWALALLTGMRNGELHALQWTDIDFERKLITVSRSYNSRVKEIKSTKAGYWRDVPMSQDCIRLLLELKALTSQSQYVLPRLYRWDHGIQASILRTFCIENGLTSVRFHTLRACFGTQLLRQGISSVIVMKIAGWKDLKTMQRYIRLAGIEVAGATDQLSVLPPEEIAANVVAFKPRTS